MEFRYRNGNGEESLQQLKDGWEEIGKYIKGYSLTDNGPRTFLICRVVDYMNGSEKLLRDPFQNPPEKSTREAAAEILFTGFPAVQRARLEQISGDAGMKVVKSITNKLSYLCAGPNAGPTKVHAARERGLFILSEPDLKIMIETGELPDCEPYFL